jgi:iron complex outermembrane recepter protein
MGKKHHRHSGVWLAAKTSLASLVLLNAALPTNALAQTAAQTHQFDIPAGPLDQSLRRYMQLTGRQLLYPSSLVANRTAPAIRGSMNADQALRSLLSGQPILVRKQGRNVVVLTAAPAAEQPKSFVRKPRNSSPSRPPRPRQDKSLPPAGSEEGNPIVVTGSNIRSSGVGVSPLIELTSEDIERSGTGTIAEALALEPETRTPA